MNWSGHHLFREAAVIKWSQSEPLDSLADTALPHQRIVSMGLLAAFAAFALWCAVGTLERNLWLTGVLDRTDMGELRVRAQVSDQDAEHLRMGALAQVLDSQGRGEPANGEVVEIVGSASDEVPVQAVWRIADSEPWMTAGETCGLRVPAGQARPAEVIFNAIR